MSAASMPVKGSEVHRAADGLVAEVFAVDSAKDVVTLRWRVGRKWETRVCTSEQFYQYWAVARIGPPKSSLGKVFLIVVGVVVLLLWLSNSQSSNTTSTTTQDSSSTSSSTSAKAPAEPIEQPPTPAQLSDANSLDNRYDIAAESSCDVYSEDYLRSIAKFDYGWDKTGFLEQKFDKIMKQVVKPGVLTLVTHKAKLQNGYGAFEHITLYCDYDTQADKVLGFRFDE